MDDAGDDIRLTFVIPAYNEGKIIGDAIEAVYKLLVGMGLKFEVLVIDDGSTDDTKMVVEAKCSKYSELRLLSNEVNRGRGNSLRKAFSQAAGSIQLYGDADLTIDLKSIPELVQAVMDGADIAVASKHLPESNVQYPPIRRFFSKCYSFASRMLLGIPIRDCQCGLKAFRREVIKDMLREVFCEGWGWDTEIIAKSYWRGYRIVELPATITHRHTDESKVKLLRDINAMGRTLIHLSWLKRKVRSRRGAGLQ